VIKKQTVIYTILLIWALSSTFLAINFYIEYTNMQGIQRGEIINVNIGINYGNGTLVWYNDTQVFSGFTAYLALLYVADNVNSSTGAFGAYVYGINNVTEYDSVSWLYAVYNRDVDAFVKVGKWVYPSVSSNDFILVDGDVIVWVFFNWSKFAYPNFPDPTSTDYLR